MEGYCWGTSKEGSTCILVTGMEGYCWGQVRKFYLYSGDRYGRLLLATSKEVLPVFWDRYGRLLLGDK